MQQALATVDTPVDYINTHGTSTPVGDVAETGAIKETFGVKFLRLARASHYSGTPGCCRCSGSDLLPAYDGKQFYSGISKC